MPHLRIKSQKTCRDRCVGKNGARLGGGTVRDLDEGVMVGFGVLDGFECVRVLAWALYIAGWI